MKAKWWMVAAIVVVIGAGAAGWWRLHQANARFRPQLAEARARSEQTVRLREENRRLEGLLQRAERDVGDALGAIHDEAVRAKAEVADLEKFAEEKRAAKLAADRTAAEALESNRDLTKGPVLIEHCVNAGSATPVAAWQTMVWASVTGDEARLAQMISLTGVTRVTAETLLARQPESFRKDYPTPEKLAAVFLAEALTNIAAVHVQRVTMDDPTHATLTIAPLAGTGRDFPMQLGAGGWELVVSEAMMAKQLKKVLGVKTEPAKK